MSALTKGDLTVHEGDARVSDRRLSAALGYSAVSSVHRLINAHIDELSDLGGIFHFGVKNSGRGRPGKSYLLNEHQAVALAMWANTPQAREARMQIINVFVAWRRAEDYTLAQETQKPDIFAQAADRTGHVARHLNNIQDMNGLIASLTHLPIWKNGRRPKWWGNIEVRTYLTMAHREVRITDAADYCNRTFGEGTVGKTAIGEYWLRLDKVLMPTNLHGETVRALKQIGHATQSKSEASR